MIPSLEQKDRLPHAIALTRLLEVVTGLPARISERRRVMTALGLVESEAWLRVEVRVDGDVGDLLGRATTWATPHDLAHVLEMADTIAHAYDHATVSNGHVALALAASGRLKDDQRSSLLDTVAEAFGFGTLEDIDDIVDVHLRRADDPVSDGAGDLQLTLGEPWWTITRIAPWVHPLMRIVLGVMLIMMAAHSGMVLAWFIAFGAFIPFRDPRLVDWPSGPRYPRGIPLRFPILLVLSGAAGLFSLPEMAVLLFVAHVGFEGLGIFFDRLIYRHLMASGHALVGLQPYSELIARGLAQVYRGSLRDRYLRWLLPLLSLVILGAGLLETLFRTILWTLGERLQAETLERSPEVVFDLVLAYTILLSVLLAVVFLLSASGHFILATALAILPLIVFGSPPAGFLLMALLGTGLFFVHWFFWRRIPSARFPVPLFVEPSAPLSGFVAQFAVRRRLRLARPVAAVTVWESWIARLPDRARTERSPVRMVHAHLLLEAGRPGEAWDLRAAFPERADVFHSYVQARTLFLLNRHDEAHKMCLALSHMTASRRRIPKGLLVVSALTIMEVVSSVVPEDEVGLKILARLPHLADSGRVVEPVRMFRYAAAAFAPTRPILAERCSLAASGLAVLATRERATSRERYRESTLTAEGALAACGTMRYLFGNGDIAVSTVADWWTNAQVLFRLASPVEVGYEMRAMTRKLDGTPGFETFTYRLRLDLVGVLNTVRHELRVRADRLAWWTTFHHALSEAIEAAHHRKDWATLAELIEYGRLQSQAELVPGLAARKPPFVRVGGQSVLQDGFWERPGDPAPAYDLEAAASVAGGPLTWWWSTWQAGEHLYWTLLVPGATPTGGRMPMSEIKPVLAQIRDAVPIVLPGETGEQRGWRISQSPLLDGPIGDERDLARDMARLLPEQLRTAIRDAQMLISLAIAPAVEFAHVPWAMIVIDGGDERLIERARLTIAPPVATLADIARRGNANDEPLPVRLAVLDPGGDLQQAASLTQVLPAEVQIHTSGDRPTVSVVGDALRALPRASTWLFAGHTVAVPPEGRAGLSLLVEDRYDVARVIPGDALPPLPRATILLACDSGNLSKATAGEWSTLGPALLTAGTDRAVVTAFPIRDASLVDRALLAGVSELPLGEALHRAQLEQLALWRETRGDEGYPADWAGHVIIGASNAALPLDERFGPSCVWVSSTALALLDRAAEAAQGRGAVTIDITDVWAAVLDWGWESIDRPTDVALRVWNRLTHRRWRREVAAELVTSTGVGISDEVRTLLTEAVQMARMLHHRVILEEHLIAASFTRADTTARLARRLTGLDPRTIDGAAFITEREEPGWHHTGIPRLHALAWTAAAEVCEIAGAAPEPEERWYDTDR